MATEKFVLETEAVEYSHPMQSSDGSESSCPGPSLWSLITEHAPESELPNIHAALGCSLVDMYTELHAEAVMWDSMWKEKQQGSSRACTPLPDPPAIKGLVRAEVQMLLQNLKAKVKGEGRDDKEFLDRYKTKTLNYVLSCHHSPKSPQEAVTESRANSRCSVQSTSEEEIEAVREKLNATDIGEVVDHIRSALRRECELLHRQVQLLQESIRKQCRRHCNMEPTLSELKELRGALQTDLEPYTSPALSTGSTLQRSSSVFRPHPPPVGLRLKSSPSLRQVRVHRTFGGDQITDEPTQHRQQDVVDYSKHAPKKPLKKCTFQNHHQSRDTRDRSSALADMKGSPPPSHMSTCSCSNGGCMCIHSQDLNDNLGSLVESGPQRSARETSSSSETVLIDVKRGKTAHEVMKDSAWSRPVRFENVSTQNNSDNPQQAIQQQSSTFSTQHQAAWIQPELKLVRVLLSPKPPLGRSRSQPRTDLGSNVLQEGPRVYHRQSLQHEC